MNPLHWLEQHPNDALSAVVGGSLLLLFFAAWLVHWWVVDVRYWLDWLPRRKNLPGPDSLPAPRAGEIHPRHQGLDVFMPDDCPDCARESGPRTYDEWDADWQAEPWTDADADQLIATWHGEPSERTVTPDVWDEWWQGLDGLDRELILVRHAREREERLWAELVAETREMCAA